MEKHIKKYFEGTLTADERLAILMKARNDESFRDEFIRYQHLYALLQIAPQCHDAERGKKGFRKFCSLKTKYEIYRYLMISARYAAMIVLCITGTWYGISFFQNRSGMGDQNKIYAPPGQRAYLTLYDGTEVWLNAGSTLRYPAKFSGNERSVTLSGEAYFKVSGNKENPFIVSVHSLEVKALGTEFNIYGYAGEENVSISLLEGSIEISKPGTDTGKIILKPFDQLIVNKEERTVRQIGNMADFLWKEGIYHFDDEPFESIIRKLEQYYCVRIIVKDPSILDFEYTGKFFQLDGVDEILRIIQKIQPFKIEKDMENNIIYINK